MTPSRPCASCGEPTNVGQLCRDCLKKFTEPTVSVAAIKLAARKAPAWMQKAACRGKDPNLFSVEVYSNVRSNPLASLSVRRAKHLCASCPVRRECLIDELVHEQTNGPQPSIRGGALPKERAIRPGEDMDQAAARILDEMLKQAGENGLGRVA